MDYPVPDFGQDHDVMDTISNEKVASKVVGHKWAFNTPESKMKYGNKAKEIDYNFAPALDSDVVSTITHQKAAETALGSWELAQRSNMVQQRSDPICSSSGCGQYKHVSSAPTHPTDYFVPNFGQDHEISDSLANERVASKIVGSDWKFKTPESFAKYRNKAKDVDYNFAPTLDTDI